MSLRKQNTSDATRDFPNPEENQLRQFYSEVANHSATGSKNKKNVHNTNNVNNDVEELLIILSRRATNLKTLSLDTSR